jgi:hypothetical protein
VISRVIVNGNICPFALTLSVRSVILFKREVLIASTIMRSK